LNKGARLEDIVIENKKVSLKANRQRDTAPSPALEKLVERYAG
jgi:hypothetical protein